MLTPLRAVGKEEQLPTVAVPAADLTPSSSSSPSTSKKTSYHRRLAALALLLPLAFFLSFPRDLLPRGGGCHHRSKHLVAPKCPSQPTPRSIGQDWNPVGDEEYQKLAVQRFSGAIQVVSLVVGTRLSRRQMPFAAADPTSDALSPPPPLFAADGELRRLWYA